MQKTRNNIKIIVYVNLCLKAIYGNKKFDSSFNPIVKYKNYFMLISLLLVTSSKIIENLEKATHNYFLI